MYDAVVISDIHLGSDNCQAKYLVRFLAALRRGQMRTKQLILNGDCPKRRPRAVGLRHP